MGSTQFPLSLPDLFRVLRRIVKEGLPVEGPMEIEAFREAIAKRVEAIEEQIWYPLFPLAELAKPIKYAAFVASWQSILGTIPDADEDFDRLVSSRGLLVDELQYLLELTDETIQRVIRDAVRVSLDRLQTTLTF